MPSALTRSTVAGTAVSRGGFLGWRERPPLAIPYSVLIAVASATSCCVMPPAECVDSVIRSRR